MELYDTSCASAAPHANIANATPIPNFVILIRIAGFMFSPSSSFISAHALDAGGCGPRLTLRRDPRLGKNQRCYCAFIQLSEPVSLTDTSEKKMCTGLPSAVPRCSVETSRGPAFLLPTHVVITTLGFFGPPRR